MWWYSYKRKFTTKNRKVVKYCIANSPGFFDTTQECSAAARHWRSLRSRPGRWLCGDSGFFFSTLLSVATAGIYNIARVSCLIAP